MGSLTILDRPSAGAQAASSVMDSLKKFSENKLQLLLDRQDRIRSGDAYEKLNLPRALADIPPHQQQAFVSNLMSQNPDIFRNLITQTGGQTGLEPQTQETSPLQQQFNQPQSQMPQPAQQQAMQQLGQLLGQARTPTPEQEVGPVTRGQVGMGMPAKGAGAQALAQPIAQGGAQRAPVTPITPPSPYERSIRDRVAATKAGYNLDIKKDRQAWAKEQEKVQTRIDRKVKPFHKEIQEMAKNDSDIIMKANEALRLIKTGQTRSGLAGLLPIDYTFASEETRALQPIYKTLAGKLAIQGGGVLSRARMTFSEDQKPKLSQPIATQEYMLEAMIDYAQKGGVALQDIENEIVDANGGKFPEDLEQRVLSEYKKRYPEMLTGYKGTDKLGVGAKGNNLAQLLKNTPIGTEAEDPATGATYRKTANGIKRIK